MEKFICSVKPCGFSAPADRMWNLDRKATAGKLVIVCGRDASLARRHGIRAYRLSETITRDAEREARKLAASAFFQAFAKAREEKAGRNAWRTEGGKRVTVDPARVMNGATSELPSHQRNYLR